MLTRRELAGLAQNVGLGTLPLAVAALGPSGLVDHVQGFWADGQPVGPADLFYGASLTKQLTGAVIALLSQQGLLDVDAPLGRHLPDLPSWRDAVTLRQLLHHTAGLPGAASIQPGDAHWTNARALAHLRQLAALPHPPGSAENYSNLGYVCLATVAEAVSGRSFGSCVATSLAKPLGIADFDVWEGERPPPHRHLLHMGPGLPLSTGDGGLWTTARAFVAWLDSQNRDALGIADLVQQPGRLTGGQPISYGWGIGLRSFRGHDMFIHGGGWRGASAKALRCPALGLSVVVLSAADSSAAVNALAERALVALAGGSTT